MSEASRDPLRSWALELARRWNAGAQSLFGIHGNIFYLFPIPQATRSIYAPLKSFLAQRFFPDRGMLMFYDIADGLTFGSPEMQTRFFEWLEVFDSVEGTAFHRDGPPREFLRLAPLLRRFFARIEDDPRADSRKGVTLVIDFPEKIIPASDQGGSASCNRCSRH